jgi:hypothetical protein
MTARTRTRAASRLSRSHGAAGLGERVRRASRLVVGPLFRNISSYASEHLYSCQVQDLQGRMVGSRSGNSPFVG